WRKILDWIKSLYDKGGIDLYAEAADIIMTKEIGTVNDLTSSETNLYFNISNAQQEIRQKLLDTKSKIQRVDLPKEEVDPILGDSEEASNGYELTEEDGSKRFTKERVTNRTKKWYRKKRFKNTFTKEEKAINELK